MSYSPYWMPGAYPVPTTPYGVAPVPYIVAYGQPAYGPPMYPAPPPMYYASASAIGTADRPSRAVEETVQIHMCTDPNITPWEGGPHTLNFQIREYDVQWPVERLMSYHGKGKGYKITELIERGGGYWRAGIQIAFDDEKARDPIGWFGWTGRRGKPNERGQITSPPVWAIITPA